MSNNNRFGLHLRYQNSPQEALDRAIQLRIPFFQCFLVNHKKAKMVTMTEKERALFCQKLQLIQGFYVHSSYLMNLAALGRFGKHLLQKELALASSLGAKGIVFHLGSARNKRTRFDVFSQLITVLRSILDTVSCPIFLENTTHKGLSIGSDILDIAEIMHRLEKNRVGTNRVFFCLDTAHAYSFGYDIKRETERFLFFDFLKNNIGFDRISMIHLNDTKSKLGSYIDQHVFFGQGSIGANALQSIVMQHELQHLPVILELSDQEQNNFDTCPRFSMACMTKMSCKDTC